MKQQQTPLYEILQQHAKKQPLSLHVPGHKNGAVFLQQGRRHFGDILAIDVTELPGLDDLHDPHGPIAEAQALAAELYGAQQSYFLVNGSTVGNLAMILAVCEEGDVVLVQSNCHKSILHGIELAGAKPVFLQAYIDETAGVPVGVPLSSVQEAMVCHPEAKAVILTHPNYYGMSMDIGKIISYVHTKNIPVLVDEAHGAHFCLGEPIPLSALQYGADAVVHSAHKTLPAMTMGSYLHINSTRISKQRLERFLSMLQSSSPSYPIMASLDLARAFLAGMDQAAVQETVAFSRSFEGALQAIPQIRVIRQSQQDPLKVIVQTNCELSGYDLQAVFEKANLYAELADPYNVLLVLPLQPYEDLLRAVPVLAQLLRPYKVKKLEKEIMYLYEAPFVELAADYRQLKNSPIRQLSLEDAVGCVAADAVVPYPPGIPVLMRGERIRQEHIDLIRQLCRTGARLQAADCIYAGAIRVYDI